MTALLAALLVAIGLFALVVAVRSRSGRKVRDLDAVLDAYSQRSGPVDPSHDADLRRALAQTGRLAEKALSGTSVVGKVRAQLARSDWTLSPGELINVSLAASVVGVIIGLVCSSPVLAVLLGIVGAFGPYALVVRSVARRRARFDDQLPDILDLLAASLQSGAGVAAALELVVSEADEPAAGEFGRVLTATRVGESLVDALQVMADRLDSKDLLYTVQAITVQQRTGGRLAEVLAIVAEFMRGRFELRREIRALTAEGRMSAYLLGALPFAIAGFLAVNSPEYLEPLYQTGKGLVMLAGASVLMLIAFFSMSRIVKIEV